MQTLFDPEQPKHLNRVSDKIGLRVMAFLARLTMGDEFTLTDLARYVHAHEPALAPDSPSRILRALRQQGRVRYSVVSRRASLYKFEGFREDN